MQGIIFLDAMYSIFLQRKFNQDYMDSEMHHWLALLLRLVDIAGNNPELHLKLFISGKQLVIRKYRNISTKCVCIYYYQS